MARLHAIGAQLKLPASPADHAGIVMLRADDPAAIVRSLREQQILVDYRPGYVRVSPYFYNTVEDNMVLVDALKGLGARG